MKRLITDYTFDPLQQTITFNGFSEISLNRLLLITNTTHNIIIYNFAAPAKGGEVSANVLTLIYDTSGMDASDFLQIFYDLPDKTQFAISDIDSSGDYKYFGFESQSGEWYIMRKTISTNNFRYCADFSTDYTTAWANRQLLAYTNFANIF
jgi:hypothetical protein